MVVFFLWVFFTFLVTAVASSKGRSGCAWFFISLIISPLIAIIIIACMGDSDEKKEKEMKQFVKISEEERTKNQNEQTAPENNIADQLIKLADMKEKGLLTDAEYEEAKGKLLNK